MLWEYIDFDAATITLPASETKHNRQHTFPLGMMAAEIVGALDRQSPYVFPASQPKREQPPDARLSPNCVSRLTPRNNFAPRFRNIFL